MSKWQERTVLYPFSPALAMNIKCEKHTSFGCFPFWATGNGRLTPFSTSAGGGDGGRGRWWWATWPWPWPPLTWKACPHRKKIAEFSKTNRNRIKSRGHRGWRPYWAGPRNPPTESGPSRCTTKPTVSDGACRVHVHLRAHCALGATQREVRGRGLLERPRSAGSSKSRSLFPSWLSLRPGFLEASKVIDSHCPLLFEDQIRL